MELIIKEINGNTQRLVVRVDATVGFLKQLISEKFNVRPSEQKLSANNGQRIDLQDDTRTLSSYGLHSGSTVALLIRSPVPVQIFVRNEKGQTSTYNITDDETVDQLQSKIYNKEKVPVDQQRLVYNGKQLESGRRLREYDIQPLSTVYMTLRLRGG